MAGATASRESSELPQCAWDPASGGVSCRRLTNLLCMLAKHDLGLMCMVIPQYLSLCFCALGLGHVWADCVRGLISEESDSSIECVSVLRRTQTDPVSSAASCSVLQPKGRLQSQWMVWIKYLYWIFYTIEFWIWKMYSLNISLGILVKNNLYEQYLFQLWISIII